MSNSYFTASGQPSTGAFAASAPMRTEFSSIETGFNKLPALTASTAIVVNGAGTALSNTVGTFALAGAFATTGAFSTTIVQGANVSITLPIVSGTLATLAGTETLSNKTLMAPILGTPASGVMTNVTGTAAGLTAGNVTTNANLTGPITSVGNSTSVAAQTGTGSTFVMQGSPTLTTPVLGVATATSINGLTITPSTGTLTIANGASLVVAASKVATVSNTLTLAGTDGKTLTVAKSLTLDGTDATTMTFPTTSATIARTDAGQTFTGAQVFTSAVTLGTQQTTRGGLVLSNTAAGSYAATMQSSNSATVATTFTLPPDAGAAGRYLQTDGAGSTSWAAGTSAYAQVATSAASGASVAFTGLTSEDIIIYVSNLTITAGTDSLRVEFSTNNGVSYFGTVYLLLANTVLNQTPLWAQFPAYGLKIGFVTLPVYSGRSYAIAGPPSNATDATARANASFLAATPVNAIRVSPGSSTFASGNITLYGRG